MNQNELLKQIAATASVLGFTPIIGTTSLMVFNTDVHCVLRVTPQGNRWYVDTAYPVGDNLGLERGKYAYAQNQANEVLQHVTQYLVDYLEAEKNEPR